MMMKRIVDKRMVCKYKGDIDSKVGGTGLLAGGRRRHIRPNRTPAEILLGILQRRVKAWVSKGGGMVRGCVESKRKRLIVIT